MRATISGFQSGIQSVTRRPYKNTASGLIPVLTGRVWWQR